MDKAVIETTAITEIVSKTNTWNQDNLNELILWGTCQQFFLWWLIIISWLKEIGKAIKIIWEYSNIFATKELKKTKNDQLSFMVRGYDGFDYSILSWHLLVQGQIWKHQNNVWKLFKVNNKDTIRTTSYNWFYTLKIYYICFRRRFVIVTNWNFRVAEIFLSYAVMYGMPCLFPETKVKRLKTENVNHSRLQWQWMFAKNE